MENIQALYYSLELISFQDLSNIPHESQAELAMKIEDLQDHLKLVIDEHPPSSSKQQLDLL
ncbi:MULTISPECIES: hypothetical protein [Marinomonas]|jgi:hypothetical protein|uniref:Uncharacterized protein n=2 Tax=Marinomonas TaxID=28253 RepID=A0A1M5NL86_9GAMM|nr:MULTISPECIES: hypothetical protein [Marinomonas]ETI59555.1 hypothetical protein D104_12015 [Marinomonas profundimaris]SHG89959.1 hypothetical protein SAMN02745753_04673 [Marinomonas polaris DSM 16579]